MRTARTFVTKALLTASLVAACSCSRDEPVRGPEARAREQARAPVVRPLPDPLYGPSGELLESNRRVAGLQLPRGLEVTREEGRRHIYHHGASVRTVQAFFGTRLVTGAVDPIGDGAVYREATPRGVRGGIVKLDVTITPSSHGGTRVEIVEIPPAPRTLPSEAEVRAQLRLMQQNE